VDATTTPLGMCCCCTSSNKSYQGSLHPFIVVKQLLISINCCVTESSGSYQVICVDKYTQ
jgi:hypothetical protein